MLRVLSAINFPWSTDIVESHNFLYAIFSHLVSLNYFYPSLGLPHWLMGYLEAFKKKSHIFVDFLAIVLVLTSYLIVIAREQMLYGLRS